MTCGQCVHCFTHVSQSKKLRFGTMGKDPTVETDFLPDRDREQEERLERRRLEEEWKQEQARRGDG